jgi:hypothetical protein
MGVDPSPPRVAVERTPRRPRPWGSTVALFAGACMLTGTTLGPVSLITTALGLVLALTVPGLALISAMPDQEFTRSPLMTVALSVVLSAAFYVLALLGLDALGIGLSREAILIVTEAGIALSCGWSLATRRPPLLPDVRLRRPPTKSLVPLVSMAAAAAVVFSMVGLTSESPAPYQAMYATGPAAAGLTLNVVKGRSQLGLAVANHTSGRRAYRLTGALATGARWSPLQIEVPKGATWSGSLAGPVPASRCRARLEVDLQDASTGRVLTQLSVWVGTAARSPSLHGHPVPASHSVTSPDGANYCA